VTFGELFAGIGGFSLGLERAGMTCKWQVEIDPYATAVLSKHWPDVRRHDDVRTFPPQGDYGVDLIAGGFPCQDISVAGKGAGLAGERSGLWNDFARIIRTVRPRWVVIENVPALTARGLGTVLGDLAEIGFDAEWHCIPASAVGAPHQRERIWIVAVWNSDSKRSDLQCVSDSKDGRTIPQASRRQPSRVSGEPHVADSKGIFSWSGFCESSEEQDRHQSCDSSGNVADATGSRQEGNRTAWDEESRQSPSTPVAANRSRDGNDGWWSVEPDVGRVAHGVPSRVDRLRCLGNAVVPQVVEVIGRAILDAEARMTA
jgi:DNA (cytosine-5)-methyltransferase 1